MAPIQDDNTRSGRINSTVPSWAKDAIWYQIFLTRFRNGDPHNDPTIKTLENTWPIVHLTEWEIRPWTSNWYRLLPWEKNSGIHGLVDSLIDLRRYGGDLQGIRDKLDYLQELGITAIYLTPIFEAPSHHKYGASMYHHIDKNLGPNPSKDEMIWQEEEPSDPSTWRWTTADSLFLNFLQECHRRQLRVIIDGVFNHVGIPFWALQDVHKKGARSPFVDWFIIKSFDDPDTPADEFQYAGFPDFVHIRGTGINEDGPAASFKEHLKHIVKRWGDPNGDGDPSDGIDGWRLDMAHIICKKFWKEFRQWVKEINPNAYITGEVWWEDYHTNKMFDAAQWLQGDMFDGVMNYRFAKAVHEAFINTNNETEGDGIKQQLKPSEFLEGDGLGAIRREYPEEAQYVLQNLLDSHDTERLATMVLNPNRWIYHPYPLDSGRKMRGNEKPSALYRKDYRDVLKQLLVFQFTYIGAPYIYQGDEVGMWGHPRKPMIWSDLIYEPEEFTRALDDSMETSIVEVDQNLLGFYKSLCTLRNTCVVLRRGKYRTICMDDKKYVFAYERYLREERIRVIFNTSEKYQRIDPASYLFPNPDNWFILFGEQIEKDVLPAKAYRVYGQKTQ